MAIGTIPVHTPQGTTPIFQDSKPLSEIKTEPTEGIPIFSLQQSPITLSSEPTVCYSAAASVVSRSDDFIATFSQIKAAIDDNLQIHSSTPHNSQLKAVFFALAADFARVGEYKVDELIDAVFRHLGPLLINRDEL